MIVIILMYPVVEVCPFNASPKFTFCSAKIVILRMETKKNREKILLFYGNFWMEISAGDMSFPNKTKKARTLFVYGPRRYCKQFCLFSTKISLFLVFFLFFYPCF